MKLVAMVAAFLTGSIGAVANDSTNMEMVTMLKRIDSIERTLNYKTGKVVLNNGLATINVAPGFKFLEAADAKTIVEDVWGNMPGQSPLGLIVPANSTASLCDYAFILEYEDIGFVKDDDASKINYDELMEEMKSGMAEANAERSKAGFETMFLQGWASKPFYDEKRKLLHWAKELQVGNAEENTLNYDIRILGRKGVLVLQAVSGMSVLDSVKAAIDPILNMVSFNPGNQYKDFDSNTDNIAAYTVGGLVAGKVLAKVGIFALILKNIKLVALGAIALFGGLWKFITGRRRKEEEQFMPQTVPAEEPVSPQP